MEQPNVNSLDKSDIYELVNMKIEELFSSGKIIQIIDEEYSKLSNMLDNDNNKLSESKKLVMSDQCSELKHKIMNDKVDVGPEMIDLLNNCPDIDIKSGINHLSDKLNISEPVLTVPPPHGFF